MYILCNIQHFSEFLREVVINQPYSTGKSQTGSQLHISSIIECLTMYVTQVDINYFYFIFSINNAESTVYTIRTLQS